MKLSLNVFCRWALLIFLANPYYLAFAEFKVIGPGNFDCIKLNNGDFGWKGPVNDDLFETLLSKPMNSEQRYNNILSGHDGRARVICHEVDARDLGGFHELFNAENVSPNKIEKFIYDRPFEFREEVVTYMGVVAWHFSKAMGSESEGPALSYVKEMREFWASYTSYLQGNNSGEAEYEVYYSALRLLAKKGRYPTTALQEGVSIDKATTVQALQSILSSLEKLRKEVAAIQALLSSDKKLNFKPIFPEGSPFLNYNYRHKFDWLSFELDLFNHLEFAMNNPEIFLNLPSSKLRDHYLSIMPLLKPLDRYYHGAFSDVTRHVKKMIFHSLIDTHGRLKTGDYNYGDSVSAEEFAKKVIDALPEIKAQVTFDLNHLF